jgi:dipeptidyl aminopeptidase/acylaminoacyl peptidase
MSHTDARRAFAALALSLCFGTGALAAPSIADFASQADAIYPSLSPDGQKVAFVTRAEGQRILMVVDLAKRERRALMNAIVDSFEISYCQFKNDERLLCGFRGTQFFRGQPYTVSRLVAVDVSGKTKPRVLIQNGTEGGSQFQDQVLDWQRDDPKRVLIQLSGDRDPFPTVHSLDVYTGLTYVVQRSRSAILDWTADRNGVVRFGYGFDGRKHSYIARDSADGPWRTLARWETGQSDFSVVGFGVTPSTLLVEASHNGRNAVFEMDLNEQSDRQLLFSNPEVDVDGPIYWPVDNRIIGFRYETDRTHRKLFDAEAQAIYDAVDRLNPGCDNSVVSSSRDGKRLLVISRLDTRPTEYSILDLNTNRLLRVGSANPALAAAPLAPMKAVKIKAADGTILPGYLTLPVGSEGKKLPTVVYPHGGPHARDSWHFDPMVQFMASRGFAVVQVNFRGSTGYGKEWYEAGLRNWGTVMVDDVIAATRWSIAEGIADPARTCIVGWSFGGYAALMSAVRESELYRCVVSVAGVSDLRLLASEWRFSYGGANWSEYALGDDSSELKAGSPTRSAGRIQAPVLLIHGDNDTQAGVDHSRRMARALNGEKKQVELVVIKDGNHSLTRYEWRETLYTRLEAFLAANSGGPVATAAAN